MYRRNQKPWIMNKFFHRFLKTCHIQECKLALKWWVPTLLVPHGKEGLVWGVPFLECPLPTRDHLKVSLASGKPWIKACHHHNPTSIESWALSTFFSRNCSKSQSWWLITIYIQGSWTTIKLPCPITHHHFVYSW
jgi:hypothetical protein